MKPINPSDLIRDSGQVPKTVVFVGNGAIKNGWAPLRTSLDNWISSDTSISQPVRSLRCQNSEAFHQLAILSYKFKVGRGEQFLKWVKEFENPKDTEKRGLHAMVRGFLDLRTKISNSYVQMANELELRMSSRINELIGDQAAYVTTNWDETLWREGSITDLVQLHGRCSFDHSLVFPTELLIEDTPYELAPFMKVIEQCAKPFQMQVYSTFRYLSMSALFDALTKTTKWLGGCQRLVIWGYSLGDYDADINAAIGTYLPQSTRELIVINPDPASFRRAVALTNVTSAIHFDPITETTMRLS